MPELKKMAISLKQLEYSINLTRRIIYMEGELDTFAAPFVLERINVIRDLDVSRCNDDINLYITSPGGDVNGLTAVIDIIEALPCKINTYGIGHVESAAVWILAAGTGIRKIAKNTEIMVHELSTWLRGTTSDFENEAKQIIVSQNNLYALLEKFSKKDEKFWSQLLKNGKNLYLTPETCIEYGLADKIIEPGSL